LHGFIQLWVSLREQINWFIIYTTNQLTDNPSGEIDINAEGWFGTVDEGWEWYYVDFMLLLTFGGIPWQVHAHKHIIKYKHIYKVYFCILKYYMYLTHLNKQKRLLLKLVGFFRDK